MAAQQRQSTTADALSKLRQAEQKIVAAMHHASAAFRALATVDAQQAQPFTQHAEAFMKQLHDAQTLIRERIRHVGTDLPFENITMRRLIEADLAVQRTAHVHRSLVRALTAIQEIPVSDAAAPSPPFMPSPAASTPLHVISGSTAAAPSPTAAAITVAVPTPDGTPSASAVAQSALTAGALNGVPADTDDGGADEGGADNTAM